MPIIPESAWQDGEGPLNEAAFDIPLMLALQATVRRHPDALAVADPSQALTYRELWNAAIVRAGEIAAQTAPGDRVGIRFPAGVEYAVTLIACLAAKRVGVLLDMADPDARIAEVLRTAGVTWAIGSPAQTGDGVRWLMPARLETGGPLRELPGELPVVPATEMDAPTFIVATSGSSGVPKLIVHSQRSQRMAVHQRVALLDLTPADRSVFTGGMGTAAALHHMFVPLMVGAATLNCDLRTVGLKGLLDLMTRYGGTTLRIVPSLARVFAALPASHAAFATLRVVMLVGEPLLTADLPLLRRALSETCRIVNSYGMTEQAVSFEWTVPPGEYSDGPVVASGRLRAGGAFVLLDEDGKPCPPGVAGELLIRSRYSAIGEWVEGACVPGRLLPDPERNGVTIYRTGDLARVGPDGNLHVLGRADRQVKVNGNRIELAEIEAKMRGIPGIEAAAVVARRQPERTRLLGFFVASPDAAPDMAGRLRGLLAPHLQPAMVPTQFHQLDRLPMLPGFKLDTAALLAHAERADSAKAG